MSLSEPRRAVLIDMAYEIGGAGLSQFTRFLKACRDGRWSVAAAELRNSLLYLQVPIREQQNIMVLATGKFPPGIETVEGLIKCHEGCVLEARPDAKGKWAYGYGHDIPNPEGPIPTCTQAEAEAWLAADLALAEGRACAALGPDYW